jgi:hypothetical protein
MSYNLPEPLHSKLVDLETKQGLTKPATFACNHNRDVCRNCVGIVTRWIATEWKDSNADGVHP